MKSRGERGIATVVALVAMLLLSVLGAALILNSSSEMGIAGNFRNAREGLYAAEAGLERAMDDLGTVPDWSRILDGSTRSGFVDGSPSGARGLPNGSWLDLGQALNLANCGKAAGCSLSDLTANTALRPWGANNPIWVLYAYGPLSSLLPGGAVNSPYYVMVMAADDPSENDGDPLRDGDSSTNPGAGVLTLRAEAFGPSGAHQVIESTVVRAGLAGVRVLSWREVR